MPKPFSITIDVEESAVGQVFRMLHRTPGVIKLHLDLDPEKAQPVKKNGEARKPYVRARDVGSLKLELLKLVSNGKPMLRSDIHAKLNPSDAQPRKTSVRNCIYNSQRDGFLKDAGKGQVTITEKGKTSLKPGKE
jgi:hypothetical protein